MSDNESPVRPAGASALFAALSAGASVRRSTLKHVETIKGEDGVDLKKMLTAEKDAINNKQDDERRDYFFAAAVDQWYTALRSFTFESAFVSISAEEGKAIIKSWREIGSIKATDDDSPIAVPPELDSLIARIDEVIANTFAGSEGVFVKLSTRSPKDSKTIFRKAKAAFNARMASAAAAAGGEDVSLSVFDGSEAAASASSTEGVASSDSSSSAINKRLVVISEEMVKAAVVRSGAEAATILLDSWRVAEDLMYAFEEGEAEAPVTLVIRAWDERICPQCEFRGFVWGGKLTCVGQYWHSLFFPELQAVKEIVARDCLALFEQIKFALPVPTAMLDLAWLGPGNVILIEVNPLMEGLGSFKGSTGLFDYEEPVLVGELPFEIRIREEEEKKAEMIRHMSLEWRKVVYGF